MYQSNAVAIDLAKKVCQIHYYTNGEPINKAINTNKVIDFFANREKSTVVMETCGTSNYWGRKFQSMGHDVRLLPAQFVKPYVIGNKNDKNDAVAIWVAAHRPDIRSVPLKTIEQQEVNCLHNLRATAIINRTKSINQIRALLRESGISTATSKHKLFHQIADILEDADNGLEYLGRFCLEELRDEWSHCDRKVKSLEDKLKEFSKQNEVVQRLLKIPGVGLITATAIVASYGDFSKFKNGRFFAAWLGLTPSHSGSGGKVTINGLSKRCDVYIKRLMVHGARSILSLAIKGSGQQAKRWAKLEARIGFNKTCVAIANRNARTIWAMITRNEEYKVI